MPSIEPPPHLVFLHFGHQILEDGRAAEADHGFTLVSGQTLNIGQGHARQHDLLTPQEVLELHVKVALPTEGTGDPCDVESLKSTFFSVSERVSKSHLTWSCP